MGQKHPCQKAGPPAEEKFKPVMTQEDIQVTLVLITLWETLDSQLRNMKREEHLPMRLTKYKTDGVQPIHRFKKK